MAARNRQLADGLFDEAKAAYAAAAEAGSSPADCTNCGQCAAACPQLLPVNQLLAECREALA